MTDVARPIAQPHGTRSGPARNHRETARHTVRSVLSRTRFAARFGPRYLRESAGSGRSVLGRARDVWAGFDPNEADWYRQLRGDTSGVFTNYHRETRLHGLNGHYAYLLDNKALFAELMAARGLSTPCVFAAKTGGTWHWRDGGRDRLQTAVAAGEPYVIKPTLGSKGRSIAVCTTLADMDGAPAEDAVATAFVRSAGYAAAIFPAALNTLRLLMVRDAAGVPLLAAAIHRFGTARSAPVDNFSAGGIVAKVDITTGKMAAAVAIAPGNRVETLASHPDGGAPIEGVAVPHWEKVRRLVTALGEAFPELAYVGWDVAVTEEGPTVIEGNAHPSLRFFQLYDRLRDDGTLAPILGRNPADGS